jgi:lincosamide and streptogramin A transport system ATP-binding/permease protein
MSLINVSKLTFSYDSSFDNIFEDVSFQIDTDWKLGFTGRNGKGKTTFFNLLMRKYEYSGMISASVEFSYFPFEVDDSLRDTIEVVEGIYQEYELWELQKELSLLEVSADVLYRPFATLSNGEQTKVLLAILFLKKNNFLLIDEPTNHLDINARKIVSKYLKSKSGFILVSHDRVFLDYCIDHILSINKANIEIQKGNFSSWQNNKKMQDDFEFAENEKLQKDIKKLTAAAKRTANWSDSVERTKIGCGVSDRGYVGHKAAKMMKRSKAIEARQMTAIEEKSKLLKNIDIADSLVLEPLIYHKKTLIEASNLSIYYGDKGITQNIDFTVNIGDRIALCGKNGSGKSSILKLIMGENISFEGELNIGNSLAISYVSQDVSFLNGNLKDFARNENIDESLFKSVLRKLDFSRIQFEKNINAFSAGQKKKVLLAKSLCQKAHLYIWDEPLNFIDILSRIQIEELILEYQPTMLFVEHDSSFNDEIATKKVYL